ncbi:DUF4249 domain-containing protein [Emticicia fontis]
MHLISKIFVIALVLLVGACVTPFEINLSSEKKYLVIEGTLTDIDANQTISIQETHNYEDNNYNVPVLNLKVEVIINGAETIHLTEKGNGIYALPFAFRIQTDHKYKLRFQKPDGTIYESSEEKTTKVPTIDRIFDEFEGEGIKGELRNIPANYIYLDFKDDPNTKDFYVWTWKLWENQLYCRTDYYDYYCKTKCWEILENKDFNVFSDVYSNGKPANGKLIAKIPFYSFDGALLEIKQQAISEQVFRYYKLISDQTQTNGTLVDTPPAAIVGNIKNINNPDEPVSGVFSVASTVKQKYWIDRKNSYGKAIPVGLLGRTALPPPNGANEPCIEGSTRTPNKPEGWVD